MALITYEGVVEKGKIRLKSGVRLPENAKVYVIVPEMQAKKKRPFACRRRASFTANKHQILK